MEAFEAWQQILEAYPILRTVWDALYVSIPLACLLAYSGIFYMSSSGKILALTRRRAAYDKCARQIALLGVILGWLLLIGIRVWLYFTARERPEGSLVAFLYEMSWLLLSMGVLLSSIYYILWRILKNMPILHITLGIISAVQNCIALVALLFCLRFSFVAIAQTAATLPLPDLFPAAWDAPLWSAIFYTFPLVFGMAGAFCSVWVPLRRNRDDFGRDYYNAMIPWCSSWATAAWTLLWILLVVSATLRVWVGVNAGTFSVEHSIWDVCSLLLWLLPVPIWYVVRKSQIPMRYTFASVLALLICVSFMLPYFLELTLIENPFTRLP